MSLTAAFSLCQFIAFYCFKCHSVPGSLSMPEKVAQQDSIPVRQQTNRVNLPSVYVFSYFPFGFESRMWDLIVSVPDHCLSFYLLPCKTSRGKCLTEENEILNRWTEYCSDLYNYYNYETEGDPMVLDCPQIPDAEHQPILREEMEAAVKAPLKIGKSAGVDNIPAELVHAGWEAMIDILTTICNKI